MATELTADTIQDYVLLIRQHLNSALCLQAFPSQDVERQTRPEVEFQMNPELLLKPILIKRGKSEECLIEGSINSLRLSIKVQQADEMEDILTKRYLGFLSRHAEDFIILRRKPVAGYDLSFLVTYDQCLRLQKQRAIDFIAGFIEGIGKEIADLRAAVSKRAGLLGAQMLVLLQ